MVGLALIVVGPLVMKFLGNTTPFVGFAGMGAIPCGFAIAVGATLPRTVSLIFGIIFSIAFVLWLRFNPLENAQGNEMAAFGNYTTATILAGLGIGLLIIGALGVKRLDPSLETPLQ